MNVYDEIKERLISFKTKMELIIPFERSELSDLNKPTMMGTSGLFYCFDSKDDTGISIYFWNTGIFEIAADLLGIRINSEENFFFNYVPPEVEDSYPEGSKKLFFEKLNDLEIKITSGVNNEGRRVQ